MPIDNDFELISCQDDFVVINKINEIDFHDCDGQLGLFHQVKQCLALNELYPVHRLDKLTSGLVIFAKNAKSAAIFGQLFAEHDIEKYYLAVSDHKPKKKQGWVKGDMAKSRRGSFKLLRSMQNPAITQFKSCAIENHRRLFLLKPYSGKTHQLRVALKSVAAPILGDPLYSQTIETPSERMYLHAWMLKFTFKDKPFIFCASQRRGTWFNSPTVCQQLSQQWSQPWLLF